MLSVARFSFQRADKHTYRPRFTGPFRMTMLPPGMSANPNSAELNSAPNAPAPGQQLLAMQQEQNLATQHQASSSAANAQRIMQNTKEIARDAMSAEQKAELFKQATKVGIKANAGGGHAVLAMVSDPNFQEIGKRLFG